MNDFSRISNRNFILIAAVVAALSLTYGIFNYHRAFPEIAIDFEVPRTAALDSARTYLQNRGFDVAGYKTAVIFISGGREKRYLEKELGVERTVELAADTLDLWAWRVRFFKPLNKLEYRLQINTSGRVVAFQRLVPESAQAPALESPTARILAEAYLQNQMNIDLENWDFIEVESEDLPQRRDHTFTWELRGFRAADAPLRLKVGVQGAEVSEFDKYLDIPQEWQRSYDRQRSQNDLFQDIADLLSFLTVLFVFVYFFRHIRNRQVPWKTALVLGTALAIAKFVMNINSLPNALAGYSTTDSYSAFLGMRLIQGILGSLLEGMLIILLVGAGEYLYRRDHPQKIALHNLLTRRGFKSREFIQATLMGYILVAFNIGFVVFYYVIGRKIGFWTPADVNYDNAVSTVAPWIYPLAISMGASLLEEFWFRLFGISFFKRVFKSTAVAVIIPAFIWGFLHSSYPQEPGFARGIEVGIIGIIAGVVMLRFGIWATLVWHFVLDAVWIGLFLFQSSSAYYWISGLIVCSALLIPALVAGIIYMRKRGFESPGDLTNETVESPPSFRIFREKPRSVEKPAGTTRAAAETTLVDRLLSPAAVRWMFIIGISGFIVALIPVSAKYGNDFSLKIDRDHAIELATEAIVEKYGIAPSEYIISAFPSEDIYNINQSSSNIFFSKLSYVKRYGSRVDAERIFLSKEGVDYYRWIVLFKKEFDPESFMVSIGYMNGIPLINHVLPDTSTGAQLELDSARVIAEAEFKRVEEFPEKYHLVEEKSRQRENRRDHYFHWETVDPVLEEAHFRRIISVHGDESSSDVRWLKVPEEWERHESERTIKWVIFYAGSMILAAGLVIALLFALGKRLVRHEIRWRAGLTAGGIAFVLSGFNVYNNWMSHWYVYKTSVPVSSFITSKIASDAVSVILGSALVVLLVSLAEVMFRVKYSTSPWWNRSDTKKTVRLDLGVLIGACGVVVGYSWLLTTVNTWFDMPQHLFSFAVPSAVGSTYPWLMAVFKSILGAFIVGSLLVVAYIMLTTITKNEPVRWLLLALISILLSGFKYLGIGNPTGSELIWRSIWIFGYMAVIYAMMKFWIKGRFWLTLAAFYMVLTFDSAGQFICWKDSPYQVQGWLLAISALLPVIWVIYRMVKAPGNS